MKNKLALFICLLLAFNLSHAQEDHQSYHDNGQLKEEGKFENGEQTGEWKTYDENGLLIQTQKY